MADTTAISITAIVSSAIIGPAVMAWAARKQDRGRFTHEREMGDERFTHERVMRDTGDLRSLLPPVASEWAF
ncbi:MAG TPA: hypothetical protein VHM65_03730 [Candidatus Lustribacter sp.]|nr:hypothetical protein [Candidatus Lustribacter sp.]